MSEENVIDIPDATVEGRYHDHIESIEVFRVLAEFGVDGFMIVDMISGRNVKPLLAETFSEAVISTSEILNLSVRSILGYVAEKYIDFDKPPIVRAFKDHISNELKHQFRREMAKVYHNVEVTEFEITDEMVPIEDED